MQGNIEEFRFKINYGVDFEIPVSLMLHTKYHRIIHYINKHERGNVKSQNLIPNPTLSPRLSPLAFSKQTTLWTDDYVPKKQSSQ